MCSGGDERAAGEALPRPAPGAPLDPILLEPVDEVAVTTLVDNTFDGLLPGDDVCTRAEMSPAAPSPQFEGGYALAGLVAEHGFSALVTVTRGGRTTRLVFDTGLSPSAMVDNADRLGVRLDDVNAVVLSHGHFDHAGGLVGLVRVRGRRGLPLTLHPHVWTRRRLAVPGAAELELPTLSKSALQAEGFDVVERRIPSLLLEGAVLVTGEVDRTTDFEVGMPPAHQAWDGSDWRHDPLVVDNQALVVSVRGRGLLVSRGAVTPGSSTSCATRCASPVSTGSAVSSADSTSAGRRSNRFSSRPSPPCSSTRRHFSSPGTARGDAPSTRSPGGCRTRGRRPAPGRPTG